MTGSGAYKFREGSHVDAALSQVIEAFERTFPGRIRGYYMHGSVADHTAIATSDVDLDVVVKGTFQGPAEQAALGQAARAISQSSDLEVDIDVTEEASLMEGAEPTFKLGSHLLYGEDIRGQVPLLSIEEWGRERMFRGYFLLVRVFHRPSRVRYPIGFPQPDAEFFGYTARHVILADGTDVASTRDLIRVTGWLATALIAYEGRRYVVRKAGCFPLYHNVFNDEWSSLLEEVYLTCRGRWRSLIPDDPGDRDQLRRICARVLAFENHFLTRFKPFLLAELQRAKPREESRALWLMRELPLEDAEVLNAVQRLSR